MCKSLAETARYFDEIRDELLGLREIDNLEMFRLITDLGKGLAGLEESERTEDNYVHGCVSNVYVAASLVDGCVHYRGESESHVVRGYLAVLVEGLSGLSPSDLAGGTADLVERFARETDLKASLTPNRANAFGNIYDLMVSKAAAFR